MKKTVIIFLCLACLTSVTSCSVIGRFTATKTPTQTATPEVTATPLATMTPTPPPAVGIVDGTYIRLEDFNTRVEQLRDASTQSGETVPEEETLQNEALDALIDETLFLNAAEKMGLAVSDDEIDAQISSLTEKAGGADALSTWQNSNHYTADGFRRAIKWEMLAALVKDRILSEQLSTLEQVHVYQIVVDTQAEAQEAKKNIDLGFSFIETAKKIDKLTGGDMSWFPKGIMFVPELENVIFSLESGQSSDITEYNDRYYLFYAAEKQTGREVDSQIKPFVEHNIISTWLQTQRDQAIIEKFPNG